jgi:hypothetical protein
MFYLLTAAVDKIAMVVANIFITFEEITYDLCSHLVGGWLSFA